MYLWGTRYLGVFKGYEKGTKLVESISESGLIDKITDIASIAAYTVVGGFVPALVVINTPISIGTGESVLILQETLDSLVPGLLGLLYTGLMYYLIVKKKMNSVLLIFMTMLVGIIGVYTGILG